MKIGLSFSRCVRDIIDDRVNIDDVLVIIARTHFDPRDDDQWRSIWLGYGGGHTLGSVWTNHEWSGYEPEREAEFRHVAVELWEQGKLHQPRQFGAHPRRLPYYWLDTILSHDEIDQYPAVKKAWDNFQTIARLTNVTPKTGMGV